MHKAIHSTFTGAITMWRHVGKQ